MTLTPRTPEIGFLHRKLSGGDLYFVANTSNEPKHARAHFRDAARLAETWDPFTGEISGLPDPRNIELDLAPYESRLFYFSDAAMTARPQPQRNETVGVDLSRQWDVTFGQTGLTIDMDRLISWSDNPRTQYYSGLATYRKSFTLALGTVPQGTRFLLDFGPGTAEPLPSPPGENNMRAYIQPPVREAAEVYVNGKLAGVVWRPPYRIDVTSHLREGANSVSVLVGNSAINAMAGQPLPDYRLLWDRYGMLFVPQGMQNLHPLPSGILGPIALIESVPSK